MIGGVYGNYASPYLYAGYAQSVRPAAQRTPTEAVPPVTPAKPVRRDQTAEPTSGMELPVIREGADPVEMAVRGRIQYLDPEEQAAEKTKSPQETMEEGKCQTCESRKYQDGSDDPGVSFKTATNIAPEQAASAVRGHEMEHVTRERASAAREDRKVVSQSVTIHTAICPECGKAYVSGGTTRTATRANNRPELYQQEEPKQGSGFEAVA